MSLFALHLVETTLYLSKLILKCWDLFYNYSGDVRLLGSFSVGKNEKGLLEMSLFALHLSGRNHWDIVWKRSQMWILPCCGLSADARGGDPLKVCVCFLRAAVVTRHVRFSVFIHFFSQTNHGPKNSR